MSRRSQRSMRVAAPPPSPTPPGAVDAEGSSTRRSNRARRMVQYDVDVASDDDSEEGGRGSKGKQPLEPDSTSDTPRSSFALGQVEGREGEESSGELGSESDEAGLALDESDDEELELSADDDELDDDELDDDVASKDGSGSASDTAPISLSPAADQRLHESASVKRRRLMADAEFQMLPEQASKKRVRTEEELAIQRFERARKRKMMAQKLAEQSKQTIIDVLLNVTDRAKDDIDTKQEKFHTLSIPHLRLVATRGRCVVHISSVTDDVHVAPSVPAITAAPKRAQCAAPNCEFPRKYTIAATAQAACSLACYKALLGLP